MSKLYSEEECKLIKERKDNISTISKNKKSTARRLASEIKEDIEHSKLLAHDDKLYYESLLDD